MIDLLWRCEGWEGEWGKEREGGRKEGSEGE